MAVATEEKAVLRGTFKGGVTVPDGTVTLPEETPFLVNPPPLPVHFKGLGLDADWDKAGADAWRLIEDWEREEYQSPETMA